MTDTAEGKGLSPVKRALLELREMRARLEELERTRREPIAIIGMGCRLPGGVDNPEAYWALLQSGVDAVSEVPPERWDLGDLYDPDPDVPGKLSSRHGGFLAFDRLTDLDAPFFSISPREALSLDPQQRLLLEVAWEALEHAGQAPNHLHGGRSGVFVGISGFDYMDRASRDRSQIDAYLATGNSHSVASGRISYLLGLQGPSLSVDTACSSSLVAVHLACQSLRAGGVSAGAGGRRQRDRSARDHDRPLQGADDGAGRPLQDVRRAADGFVRGEGCGVVVLKRLSRCAARTATASSP